MYALDLDGSGITVHAITSGGVAKVNCPNPKHSESNDNAVINIDPDVAREHSSVFYCYSCGWYARTYKDLKELYRRYNYNISLGSFTDIEPTHSSNQDMIMYELMNLPLAYDDKYLISRGVSNEQVERFEIRCDADRIVFPRYNKDNYLEGLTIRFMTSYSKLRYMDYGNKATPFGLNHLDYSQDLYIVEGAFGVLNLNGFGYQAVGVLGGSSYDYRDLVWFENVYACVDDDPGGEKILKKLKKKLPLAKCVQPTEFDEIDKRNFDERVSESTILMPKFSLTQD
jgi:hypothetical protein